MEKFGLMKPASPHAPELVLYFGKKTGEVSSFLTNLGYKVETVEKEKQDMSAEAADICHYRIEPDKYSLILCHDILPFVKNKGMISIMLYRIMKGLKEKGLAFLTLFGRNSDMKDTEGMSFYDYEEAVDLIKSLAPKILDQATFEGLVHDEKGKPIHRHTHIFLIQKP